MANSIIAIDKSGSFRVYLAVTTQMVQEAARVHDTTPVATAALGRVVTGAGLMGIMLKEEDNKLTVDFKGDGPAGQILATADGAGNVKALISNPFVDLPPTEEGKLDVGGSLGIGNLTVIKDLGLKEPYIGTIALVDGEIADDLTAYFYISEQQNTSVALGVKVDKTTLGVAAAGGMIIQMLPGAAEGATDALEKLIADLDPMTTIISRVMENSAGKTEEGILDVVLADIFDGIDEEYAPRILDRREIRWRCDCSRERIEAALATIGRDDLAEIIEEDGEAELQCHFCLKKYHFNKEELTKILEEM